MAKRRTKVPSIADMIRKDTAGTAYEREVMATGSETASVSGRSGGAGGVGQSVLVATSRNMSYELALAIQDAKEGDDSKLLTYQPTPTINPPKPRTMAAGYDRDTGVMRVRFRGAKQDDGEWGKDGPIYGYADVSPNEWKNFKRVKSPGRAINRTFNSHPYWRETWT